MVSCFIDVKNRRCFSVFRKTNVASAILQYDMQEQYSKIFRVEMLQLINLHVWLWAVLESYFAQLTLPVSSGDERNEIAVQSVRQDWRQRGEKLISPPVGGQLEDIYIFFLFLFPYRSKITATYSVKIKLDLIVFLALTYSSILYTESGSNLCRTEKGIQNFNLQVEKI